MDWTLLGIEPTKDKKVITAAYRSMLIRVNPEDKPEEFKALRAAYEEALRLADQTDASEVRDESPVGVWMEQVRALYEDFPSRILAERWQELLCGEVCTALDLRPQAEDALLRFLMEDYFIPQEIWRLLDDTFEWVARREELYESYPRDFIDYAVVNGVRCLPNLPYELFQPGLNGKACDDYRRLYHRADQMAVRDMGPILEQMEALPESHPYGQALRYRLLLEQGETERALEGYRRQAEEYPDDFTIRMNWAGMCTRLEDWEQAERACRRVMELRPDHGVAKRTLSTVLAKQGRYTEAKELVYEMMHDCGGDQMQLYQLGQVLKQWNEEVIGQREQTLTEHPEDWDNALELGWCYLQNDRYDDALRAAQAVSPQCPDPYGYHNLHAKVRYGREEYAEALEHLRQAEQLLRDMTPDGTEKTARRIRSLPENIQLQGSCLMLLNRQEEGFAKYEEAMEMAPNHPEILTHSARLYASHKQYERAEPLLKRLVDLLPGSYHGHFLLAQVLFETGRDAEAFGAVNRALELEGGDLWVYILKIRILLRNGVWDGVREELDFLSKHDLDDVLAVMWCRAQLMDYADKDSEGALELYRTIARRMEQGEHFEWGARVYYRIAANMLDHLDMKRKADRAVLMDVVEKGLAQDAEDPNCMEYKAWLLKQNGETEQALELYHKLEQRQGHPDAVETNLAELYYKNLDAHADRALHYYEYLLEREDAGDLHFYAGTCCRYVGDFHKAEQHFLREQELDPGDVDGYNGLCCVYESMGRLSEALEQINKAIALTIGREGRYVFLYTHKVRILRRMNRPQEALDTVLDLMSRWEYPEGYELRFEIACQFGLWDKAQKLLKDWMAAKGGTSGSARAHFLLRMLKGERLNRPLGLYLNARLLDAEDKEEVRRQVADLNGDLKTVVSVWTRRLHTDHDQSHVLMNLAQAQWFLGDREEARRNARQALELLDEKVKGFTTDKALYRTRRALVLALLGQEREARAELALARSLPLCGGCDYCACKDADIFEAAIEEIFGNTEKACELYAQGRKRWQDELDFESGWNRLKKG